MRHNAKANLYRYVDLLRTNLNIASYPINTVKICQNNLTIDVIEHKFNSSGLCASAFVGKTKDTIILNAARSKAEQNHDCGHEIIHLTKHRDYNNNGLFSCFKTVQPTQSSFLEWEANEGSAELLVPYSIFLPLIAESNIYTKKRALLDIYNFKIAMADYFHVTEAVINYRLEGLKYEIAQYLTGTPLEEIKILSNIQQKKQNMHVKSLNDLDNEQWKTAAIEQCELMHIEAEEQSRQSKLDDYNMTITEQLRDNWLDCDYDFR